MSGKYSNHGPVPLPAASFYFQILEEALDEAIVIVDDAARDIAVDAAIYGSVQSGSPEAPFGYVILQDADGALLSDPDGSLITETI